MRRVSLRNTEPPFVTSVVQFLLKKNNKLFKKSRVNDALAVAAEIHHQIFSNNSRNKQKGSKSWWKQVNYYVKREQSVIENHFDANELNSHYNIISINLVNTRPQIYDTHGYQLPVVHVRQVFNYMSKLKKTTVGPDGLPYWLYRENAHYLAEPLTQIFNQSLSSTVFPETWKIGCIKPIPKSV